MLLGWQIAHVWRPSHSERHSFLVLSDVPAADLATIEQLNQSFHALFASTPEVKDAIAPYNTKEMPREYGYMGGMALKEQWFGTLHHCKQESIGADGGGCRSLFSFLRDCLRAVVTYVACVQSEAMVWLLSQGQHRPCQTFARQCWKEWPCTIVCVASYCSSWRQLCWTHAPLRRNQCCIPEFWTPFRTSMVGNSPLFHG